MGSFSHRSPAGPAGRRSPELPDSPVLGFKEPDAKHCNPLRSNETRQTSEMWSSRGLSQGRGTGACRLDVFLVSLLSLTLLSSCAEPGPLSSSGGKDPLLVRVPMRDGVRLAATVFLPAAGGRYPVVLQRTPYNRKGSWMRDHEFWTRNGYAYMVQDVRGRYDSEGDWYPYVNEKEDGADTLEWIHRQDWCDGKVGMVGPSYNAGVQFAAVQGEGGEWLSVIVPIFMTGDRWVRGWYSDGVFYLFNSIWWGCNTAGRVSRRSQLLEMDLLALYRHLPLLTLDTAAGCGEARQYRDIVQHYKYDDYWKEMSIRSDFRKFTMPVLQIVGWYDYYSKETFFNYQQFVKHAPNRKVARSHKVLVGPWGHHHGLSPHAKPGDRDFGKTDLDFGPEASLDYLRFYREWMDRVLKGQGPGLHEDAPIRIFVMGENRWRDEWEWPLARTRYTNYFLHSDGNAGTPEGNGRLDVIRPSQEPPDSYLYDPADPTPTRGGNHSVGPNPAIIDLIWTGPADQRPIEARPDVLSYTSTPLGEDMEITGPVILKLFAASSARDTDFVGRLVDVDPDGRAINIAEGVVRARFRKPEYWEEPQLITPGKVYEYRIDLQATSNLFKKGHRIRLDITSSNFPLWDRNLNTGNVAYSDTELRTASQTIYHDQRYASHLILPHIPRGTERMK